MPEPNEPCPICHDPNCCIWGDLDSHGLIAVSEPSLPFGAGLHVIIAGNPVDGITITGPYKTAQDAADSVADWQNGGDWWIVPLQAPPV